MQRFHKTKGASIGTPIIMNNSEVFAYADPVSIDASGHLIVATAGVKVIGYCLEAKTAASDNETVAKKTVQYLEAPGVEMVYTSDTACTQTDVGAYADLTGTTGAIEINLLAGTTGQFLVKAFDPEVDGDTDLVVVEVAEPQHLGFTQD